MSGRLSRTSKQTQRNQIPWLTVPVAPTCCGVVRSEHKMVALRLVFLVVSLGLIAPGSWSTEEPAVIAIEKYVQSTGWYQVRVFANRILECENARTQAKLALTLTTAQYEQALQLFRYADFDGLATKWKSSEVVGAISSRLVGTVTLAYGPGPSQTLFVDELSAEGLTFFRRLEEVLEVKKLRCTK